VPQAPAPGAAPAGDAAAEEAATGEASAAAGEPQAALTPAMRLLTGYKRTGGRLLRHAEAGDAEAAFRLAVLLLCGDRPLEATEWLRRATRAGHADAAELLHHPRQQAEAARHAYRIGRHYETAGNLPAALAFLEQAADAAPP
jgi:TPR repeat protein